jgi:hypothetical protein
MLSVRDEAGSERLEVEVGPPEHPLDLTDLDISHPLQTEIMPQLRLLGYNLKREALLAGNEVGVQLFWEALSPMSQDYGLRLALVDRDGATRQQREVDILGIDYPTTKWHPGDVLEEWYTLPTPGDTPSGDVSLNLNLVDDRGAPVLAEPFEIASLWIQAVEPSFELPDDVDQRDTISLEDQVALLAYDVEPVVTSGETAQVKVTLYWRAQREMDTSYKVFVHLYDEEGGILTQRDRLPGLAARPTSAWQKGEIVADRYYVPVSPDIPPGEYRLAVGLYDPHTGERLATFGSDGEPLAQDDIPLGRVEVKP